MLGRKDKDEHVNFAARNEIAGPNPEKRLSGYSLGSSNHLAQDLAVMLQAAWMLLHHSADPAEKKLCAEIAEAAQNLQACRARHGSPHIPAVMAALAVTGGDDKLRASLPEETWDSVAKSKNPYRQAFYEARPDEKVRLPGFMDDQEYRYHVAIARDGVLTKPVAFHLVSDAIRTPELFSRYWFGWPAPPPGINVFDLHPCFLVNGRPDNEQAKDRRIPIGSRCGPQNMVVCGWGLQALALYPCLWEEARGEIKDARFFRFEYMSDGGPGIGSDVIGRVLERELGGGLRTWEAIFDEYGYIPTGIDAGRPNAEVAWDGLSDAGGYAHLIAACAQWIFHLEGKRDWETR